MALIEKSSFWDMKEQVFWALFLSNEAVLDTSNQCAVTADHFTQSLEPKVSSLNIDCNGCALVS